jgi:hypothetical protein
MMRTEQEMPLSNITLHAEAPFEELCEPLYLPPDNLDASYSGNSDGPTIGEQLHPANQNNYKNTMHASAREGQGSCLLPGDWRGKKVGAM